MCIAKSAEFLEMAINENKIILIYESAKTIINGKG